MKVWEELVVGDNINFVVLDEENITKLFNNSLHMEQAKVTSISHNSTDYTIKTDSDVIDEVVASIEDYFTKSGAAIELKERDMAVVIGTDSESFTHYLQRYLRVMR